MKPKDYERLKALEESLWRSETRFDRDYMDRILAPDFFEFGRSGRRYTREETLSMPGVDISAKLPVELLDIRLIHEGVALVTYSARSNMQFRNVRTAVLFGSRMPTSGSSDSIKHSNMKQPFIGT